MTPGRSPGADGPGAPASAGAGAGPGRAADATPGVRAADGQVEGAGDVRLFLRSWEVDRPRARVVAVHGLGEHAGRWGRVAAALAGAGFSVHAADLRGHGRSEGRRGHAPSLGHLLDDLDAVLERIARAAGDARPEGRAARAAGGAAGDPPPAGAPAGDGRPGPPVFLLGHSLGGLVVLRHLLDRPDSPVRGAVAVAPFVRLAAPVPGWKLWLGGLADRLLPALTLDNELDRELLLRDPGEREEHRTDPLVHRRISARLWGEMLRSAGAVRDGADRIGRPILLQVPGEDAVVDPDATMSLAERMGERATAVRYPGAYHDLYHDPEAARALDDAVAWLEGREVVRGEP